MLTIKKDQFNNFDAAVSREWLVTNGLGGYASSTIAGVNTRRYHGLLIAALAPPVRRTLLLYKIDEEIEVRGSRYALATNEYQDRTVSPEGYHHLQEFRVEGTIPVFAFSVGGAVLEKAIWMEQGQNTTYVRYALSKFSEPIVLQLTLLTSYRDHHGRVEGSPNWHFQTTELDSGWEIRPSPDGFPLSVLASASARFEPGGLWHWHFLHRRELERGLDFVEDAYNPGIIIAELQPGCALTLAATIEEPGLILPGMADCFEREKRRGEHLIALSQAPDSFARQLVWAADHFIVSRRSPRAAGGEHETMPSVIAGYHWFTDWGRDTFVSLPGLFLATGRQAEASALLKGYAAYIDNGMLPNYLPEDGAPPMYNSVDAALWYFYAVERYLEQTGDWTLIEHLYPTLEEIIARHLQGTRYNISVDPADGLLRAGEEGVQLTWMDAKIDDWVVTARRGKPVEINALWYNALAAMAAFGRGLGKPAGIHSEHAHLAWGSFNEKYWRHDEGCLYDVIDSHLGQDASFRPNQILAVSLPYPVLRRDRWKGVVDKVAKRLLTPFGLRTLPSDDPMYLGSYAGGPRHRDVAYHQGTVWPWLLGQFVDAHMKVYGDKVAARQLLSAFESHLKEAGVGFIGEIFDGDRPHAPQGCIAQAWSVAEVLRTWLATE